MMKMNLSEINWFENIGKPLREGEFIIPTRAVLNIDECLKCDSALNWGNLILYARNRLSWYIQSFHKEESRKCNEISAKARLDYADLEPKLVTCAIENHINKDILVTLRSNIIGYTLERHYLENVDENIPKQFAEILCVYHSGHIPCGWDGPMPKNEGYDAVDFKTGKLLVW